MTHKNIPTYELSRPIIIERIENRSADIINKPHRHDFYEILWFNREGSKHIVDFQPFPVRKDTIFFMAPGIVHQMNLIGQGGLLLVFSKDFMSQIVLPKEDNFFNLFFSFENLPFVRPDKDELYKLNLLLDLILLEYNNEPNNTGILQSYLRAFLLNAQRIKEKTEKIISGKSHKYLVKLFQLIEDHYKTDRTATFYSAQLALTPKRVNEIIKARLGKSLTQLLHERLILEAKRELYFGQQSIKEITYMLGFNDPAYFSRFFKKRTGNTPKQFQTKMFK